MSHRVSRSRVSSPFVAGSKNSGLETRNTKSTENGARRQTTLEGWMEPPVGGGQLQPAVYGAALNMAPLGTLPSAKLLKQVAALQAGEVGHEPMKKSGLSNPSTPAESTQTEPALEELEEKLAEENAEEVTEDTTEAPETPPAQIADEKSDSRPEAAPPSVGEGVSPLQDSPDPTATMSGPAPSSRNPSVSPAVPPPIVNSEGKLPFNLEWTDRVVEAAVQEAVDQRRWPTAYGLRTLYDEHRSDPDFIRLVEAVYYKYATNSQFEEFEAMLAPKKREGRKDRTGEYYFNGDGSDPAPARSILSYFQALNGPQREYRSVYSEPPRRSSSVATDAQPGGSHIHSSNAATPSKENEASHVVLKLENNKPPTTSVPANGEGNTNGTASKDELEKSTSMDRSNSLSSSSSLSSVDEKLIANSGISPARPTSSHALASFGRFGVFDSNGVERPFVSPYASANNFQALASSAETLARRNAQPIKKAPKPGPKIHTFSVTTTSVPAPTPAAAAAAASSSSSTNNFSPINAGEKSAHNNNNNKSASTPMAPAALVASSSNSSAASLPKHYSALASKNGSKPNAPFPDDVAKRMKLKRVARDKTNLVRGDRSFERHKVHVEADNETASEGEDSVAVAPPPAKRQKIRILNNSRTTRRNVNDDSDELSSPTFLNFNADGPSSFPPSRAGTPSNSNRPTRKGKAGTGSGLRVKTSPMKKKQGSSAGIPRTSRGRNSPVGNGNIPQNQEENDDNCAACGGGGVLLCCDGVGCARSFHFRCVDPPLSDEALPPSWLCHECNVKQSGHDENLTVDGIFGPLATNLQAKNSSAFHLPKNIRTYFEHVKTGPDGEYEDDKPVNVVGAIDYFRTRDSKNKVILCHGCGLLAQKPDRMIMPCSFCDLYWHLDCIPDAPLAKQPPVGREWRCPAHIDDLLNLIPEFLGPAHRFRKIKNLPAVKPALSRGIKNNGHIEIENDPTDDEVEEEKSFHEVREFGQILRLPEKGIKLDFLAKVRAAKQAYTSELVGEPSVKRRKTFHDYSLEDQQAALTIKAVKTRPNAGDNTLNILTQTLIEEMPDNVIDLLARSNASEIAQGKKRLTKTQIQAFKATQATLAAMLAAEEQAAKDEEAAADAADEEVPKDETPRWDQEAEGDSEDEDEEIQEVQEEIIVDDEEADKDDDAEPEVEVEVEIEVDGEAEGGDEDEILDE